MSRVLDPEGAHLAALRRLGDFRDQRILELGCGWSLWWVQPEDVVHVLRNMVEAVKQGGVVLDLQVIRPNPLVEADSRVLCEIDGAPLFRLADAAAAAVDSFVTAGRLLEEAADDHDVLKRYANGADLLDDFADKERGIPDQASARVRRVTGPSVTRERCRLRRLVRLR